MINKRDIRFIPLLIVSIVVLYCFESVRIIGWMTGIIVTIILLSHILRRFIFPYMDLREYIEKAREDSISSALIAVAIIYFYTHVFEALVSLYH